MSRLILRDNYDLYISMTWTKGNHGISGHVYEILEYYFILKDKIKVAILLCEDIDWEMLYNCIVSKYHVSIHEIKKLREDVMFCDRPKYIFGRNILFVDGSVKRAFVKHGVILCFKNIICFRCSPKDTFYDLPYKNITLLQDDRVYSDGNNNTINYIKKILFKKYKTINDKKTNTALLYLTSNCRRLDPIYVRNLILNYTFDKYILLTNEPARYYNHIKDLNVLMPELPINNIFEQFDTYIYTPTDSVLNPHCGCFDCSPRFIVECEHYGKKVIYHDIDAEYLNKDTGLKYRRIDIRNNIDSVHLHEHDKIIEIVQKIINE